VLLRALEQRNALDTVNGRIAVGWLIVEDLVMVLALVLLPALAGALGGDARGLAAQFAGGSVATALALTIGKVALFVALVFLVGTRVVPWILQLVARTGSRELFTLSVLAIAFGIAYGSAELFGVSFALGAFFAGVVLSESDFSHQAAADSLPLQDAFAVLFFVSVGMLFDPGILARQPLQVLAVVMLIVFGKSIAAFAIVLARGYPVTTAPAPGSMSTFRTLAAHVRACRDNWCARRSPVLSARIVVPWRLGWREDAMAAAMKLRLGEMPRLHAVEKSGW
jgi:CPA2 family monovalent cation:H+ antiporter-2